MQKGSPREVFMYLLGTITLYFSAFSVINLLFQYINVGFPDPLNPYYDPGGSIRLSLALLIIIFPVYFWVSRTLTKDITQAPEKRDLRVRKWLLYFTLFLAALLIIGDLVTLIYQFLQGEITVRFILKIAGVLLVAGGVFWYYLYDLRREAGVFSSAAKMFVRGTVIAVVAIVVGGFFVAGSPFTQRLVRFDTQKVNDLQLLQGQIIDYWMQKSALPKTLSDLHNSISGFTAPMDPQSGTAYEYKPTGALSFDLCADFNLPASAGRINTSIPSPAYPGLGNSDNWNHGAGPQCFSRTIDPQIYRPTPTK